MNIQSMPAGARRIKQNAWGNWYGYIGRKNVVSFSATPFESMEDQANRWLKETGDFNPSKYE
jgi:hypothetical protein